MIRTNEKSDRSVEVANPALGRARIKVERTFFLDLGGGVRRRKDLAANVWGAPKNSELANILGWLGGEPGDIDGFDATRGGHRAFGHGAAIRKQLTQQETDINLALANNFSLLTVRSQSCSGASAKFRPGVPPPAHYLRNELRRLA